MLPWSCWLLWLLSLSLLYSLPSPPFVSCSGPIFYFNYGYITAIFGIVAYGAGIPFVFSLILMHGHKWLYERDHFEKFSYLLQRFKHNFSWWELIILLRKFLITFAIVTFTKSPFVIITCSFLVILFALVAQLILSPYKIDNHNWLEAWLLGIQLVMLMFGLVLSSDGDVGGQFKELVIYTTVVIIAAGAAAFVADVIFV